MIQDGAAYPKRSGIGKRQPPYGRSQDCNLVDGSMRLRGKLEIMATNTFHADVENAGTDAQGNKVTTVRCHGKIVSDTGEALKQLVKPLIGEGGRIVLDLGDVSQLDSSGLGALVALKATAVNHGYCILEFENLTPRILELVKITNLTNLFAK